MYSNDSFCECCAALLGSPCCPKLAAVHPGPSCLQAAHYIMRCGGHGAASALAPTNYSNQTSSPLPATPHPGMDPACGHWHRLEAGGEVPAPRGWLAATACASGLVVHGGNSLSNERLGDMFLLEMH